MPMNLRCMICKRQLGKALTSAVQTQLVYNFNGSQRIGRRAGGMPLPAQRLQIRTG